MLVAEILALLRRLQDPVDLGLLRRLVFIINVEHLYLSDITKLFAGLGKVNSKIGGFSTVDMCDLELCM